MLYKMDLLCIEADVFSVVNIRLDLRNHAYTKSQRKIKRLVEQRFTIAIGPAKVSQSRQRLYDGQKSRFKGFIHESLDEYLHAGFHNTVFDTQEVCVYDSDRLIAVSFFDLGERSMASLLALYDPEYESYSLGTYTMLKEIEFGKQTGRTWYYPGYVLDQPSAFDYKLRLGPMEYYTPSKRWGKFENFDRSETVAFTLRSAMSQLIQRLNDDGIEMKEWFYPYFSMGYMPLWKDRFLHLPWIVELGHDLDGMCAVGFCAERKRFLFVHIHPCPDEQHFINMEQAREFGDHTTYLSHLMEYGLPVAEGDLATILPFIENWQTRPDKIAPV
jgi:arginyl-tRNA--protein-N-Asp/Glu arginylyltransferase